ncbi:alpha/beta fold hydrolase [Nitriliruptor alkaliphilus]|uniref:alpha/beta fold hydrolase n=1 Tax=Nitriliruptor alkaliphilus TaxID=427918 RepID=UPI000695EE35|nr:alpha/beta hydrolase [Nitriliruptor alkaliphilus]
MDTSNEQAATGEVGLVLVHGAELGAWLWERTLAVLRSPAVAVDLPGRGAHPARGRDVTPSDAVDAIVDAVERCGTPRVVLVLHSFSGALAAGAVARLGSQVAAVVLVGASVPADGEAWIDDRPVHQRLLLRTLYRLRPDGMLSPAGQTRELLCHDLDEVVTDTVLTQRVPEPPRPLLEAPPASPLPTWLPRHYVRLADDRIVSASDQQRSIDRLGPDVMVHDLASGHLPMLGRPEELGAILTRIVRELDERHPLAGSEGGVS